ncbi:unnamed protein product, partial [Brenthis ino]
MKLLLRHKKAAKALSPQSNEPYCLQKPENRNSYGKKHQGIVNASKLLANEYDNLDSQPNLISLLLVIDSQGLTTMP